MITLGNFVRDKVTGLEGVAENRATFLDGCDRYFVQPQVDKDGKVPNGFMIDEPQLEIKDLAPAMKPMTEPAQTVTLGSIVNDPIRGEKGTATGRAVYLNGCSRIYIQPKKGIVKLEAEGWWVDEQQVVKIKQAKVEAQPKEKIIGGPARSCSKY